MGSNPEWFAQIRARGLCHLCRRPMPDDNPRLAHRECYHLQWRGWSFAEIRHNPPLLTQINRESLEPATTMQHETERLTTIRVPCETPAMRNEALARLKDYIALCGGQKAASVKFGCSPQFVGQMVNGKRGIPERVLKMLGLKRMIVDTKLSA